MTRIAGGMLLGALLVTLMGGCACGGGAGGQVGEDSVALPSPGSSLFVVRGTVGYRERIALPDDAVIDVWITDVTPGLITTQAVTAQASVATHGRQVPIPFALDVPVDRVVPDHDYGLRAVIRAGGQELFSSETPVPVLTKGHTGEAQVWVKAAPGADR